LSLTLLDKLINSKLLKETFNNKICSNILKNEKEQLLKYKALFKRGITASSSINGAGEAIRAEQPEHRLGLHVAEIRQTLTKGRFKDIDIKNCHPTILYNLSTGQGRIIVIILNRMLRTDRIVQFNHRAYKCTRRTGENPYDYIHTAGGLIDGSTGEKLDASLRKYKT
jgi:hypothetical protein